MALEIEWSILAKQNLAKVIDYLERKWTEKELRKFSRALEEQLQIISNTPTIYKKSERYKGTRECIIARHNSLFYTFDDDRVYIVTFWHNKQNPEGLGIQ